MGPTPPGGRDLYLAPSPVGGHDAQTGRLPPDVIPSIRRKALHRHGDLHGVLTAGVVAVERVGAGVGANPAQPKESLHLRCLRKHCRLCRTIFLPCSLGLDRLKIASAMTRRMS